MLPGSKKEYGQRDIDARYESVAGFGKRTLAEGEERMRGLDPRLQRRDGVHHLNLMECIAEGDNLAAAD